MPPREEIAPKDNAKPVSEEWMGIGLELGRPLCYVTSRTPLKIEQTTAFPYSQKSHSYLSGGSIKKELSFFKYINLKPDSSDYCSDKAQYFCHLTPSQPKKHPPFFKQQVFLRMISVTPAFVRHPWPDRSHRSLALRPPVEQPSPAATAATTTTTCPPSPSRSPEPRSRRSRGSPGRPRQER